MDKELALKIAVVVLALLQPLAVLYCFNADFKSLSTTWGTFLQPLFIITNVTTSYYFFFCAKKWVLPSIFLILLTAFSVNLFPELHNFIASLFFLSCLYPLYEYKRLRLYAYAYSISVAIGFLTSLFWFEFWGVYVLCTYHLHLLWIKYKWISRN